MDLIVNNIKSMIYDFFDTKEEYDAIIINLSDKQRSLFHNFLEHYTSYSKKSIHVDKWNKFKTDFIYKKYKCKCGIIHDLTDDLYSADLIGREGSYSILCSCGNYVSLEIEQDNKHTTFMGPYLEIKKINNAIIFGNNKGFANNTNKKKDALSIDDLIEIEKSFKENNKELVDSKDYIEYDFYSNK